MKRWMWVPAAIALAGCGGSGPSGHSEVRSASPVVAEVRPDTLTRVKGEENGVAGLPLADGFYRLTDVEGAFQGMVSAVCYAPGHGNQYLGEAIGYPGAQDACGPIRTRATANGWVNTMTCNDPELGQVDYTFTGRREAGGDLHVRDTALVGGRTPRGLEPRSVRSRHFGPCPSGWRPGDFMIISRPGDDGRYTSHQIGQPPDARSPRYDRLPASIARLLD